MRIVQVANFYSATSGGLRTAVDAVGRGYLARGHERIVVVPGADDSDVEGPDGRVVTLASPRLPGGAGYRAITDHRRLKRLLADLGPDRLEVSDKLNLTCVAHWGRRHGVPAILWSHERLDAILAPRIPWATPLRLASDRWNRRFADSFDAVVCSSAFAAGEYERIGVRPHRVPLGVDLTVFNPAARTPRFGDREDGVVRLVSLGRLSTEKRVDVAIEALRRLHERGVAAHLCIAGEGPRRAELEALAAGLPVSFVGHVAEPVGVAALCAQADVALVTGPHETFGLAALEALACGTPVVVADSGATRELVARCAAGVVSPVDGPSFARAVQVLVSDEAGMRRSVARLRAQRYCWSRTVSGMLDAHARVGLRRREVVAA